MKLDRRTFLEHSASWSLAALAWATGLISPGILEALEIDQAFSVKNPDQLLELLADRLEIKPSNRIELDVPEVAENGAIVPVTVTISLEEVRTVALIAEKNPVPLIARITLENGAEAFIQARIKMAESSHLIVLVNAANQLYSARKYVEVTVGGCGT